MKNTLKKGQFRILIYKGKEGYVGICYETGWVEIWPTPEECRKHLADGFVALFKMIEEGKLSEKSFNQKPSLKYRIIFYFLPVLASFLRFLQISFFTEPIKPCRFANP